MDGKPSLGMSWVIVAKKTMCIKSVLLSYFLKEKLQFSNRESPTPPQATEATEVAHP